MAIPLSTFLRMVPLPLYLLFLFFSAQRFCRCKRVGKPMKQDLQLQQEDKPRIQFLHAYMGAVLKAVRYGKCVSYFLVCFFFFVCGGNNLKHYYVQEWVRHKRLLRVVIYGPV